MSSITKGRIIQGDLEAFEDGAEIFAVRNDAGEIRLSAHGRRYVYFAPSAAQLNFYLRPYCSVDGDYLAYLGETIATNGQAWQDVTASRAPRTVYQNTTGHPLFLSCAVDGAGGWSRFEVSSDGTTFIESSLFASVVPDGHFYRVDTQQAGASVVKWSEVR